MYRARIARIAAVSSTSPRLLEAGGIRGSVRITIEGAQPDQGRWIKKKWGIWPFQSHNMGVPLIPCEL